MSDSGLKVGIVGLPNAGKSTLFNALAARRLAETAAHPFTTIEPHEAVVPVPDENVKKLAELVRGDPSTALRMTVPEKIPATVTFIDIAGLVKGAHQGEGLGNQFLGKIREVDAIVHVVRAFEDPNAPHVHGSVDPKEDIEVVNIELELGGITGKPVIYVVNVGESQLTTYNRQRAATLPAQQTTKEWGLPAETPVIVVSAKLEEELADLEPEERREYLREFGVEESGLEKLIREAYKLLGLITFYSIKPSSAKASEGQGGGNQVTAWSIKDGSTAHAAAGKVHTDFAENFIKAEVIDVEDLLRAGSWVAAKKKGKVRLEGRDYVVRDRDVIEFKTSV